MDASHPDLSCPIVTLGESTISHSSSSYLHPWECLKELAGGPPKKKRKVASKVPPLDSSRTSPRNSPRPTSLTSSRDSPGRTSPVPESRTSSIAETSTSVVPESSKSSTVPEPKTSPVSESRTSPVPEFRTALVSESRTSLFPERTSMLFPEARTSVVSESSPAKPQVKNAAFPVESASNLMLYLRSNGMGLSSLIQGVTTNEVMSQPEGDGPVAVQVLIPAATSIPCSNSLSSLASTIKAIQTPKSHALLNHIIATASRNPQVISCLSLTPATSSVVTSLSSNLPLSNSVKSFPNSSALKKFKIPKKSTPAKQAVKSQSVPSPQTTPKSKSMAPSSSPLPSQPLEISKEYSSTEAAANSVCLKRKRCGLSTTPCNLLFTITNSSGRKWTSYDLEGK